MKDPRVFVLGVYASAVHAWWLNLDGSTRVVALAAASEPHIFWGGEGETEIIASIQVPAEADHLVLPGAQLTLVLFAGEVLSSGGKISKPMIRFIIETIQSTKLWASFRLGLVQAWD